MENIVFMICIVVSFDLSFAAEPTVAITCKGEHEYRDVDGSCKRCEKCPEGTQIHGACGYGERAEDYQCEQCPAGEFSSTEGYDACVVCRPCETWNSYYESDCTTKDNSVCGLCFDGYYRKPRSGAALDDECLPCTEATEEMKECKKAKEFPWSTVAVTSLSSCIVLVLIIAAMTGCFCHRKRLKFMNRRKNRDCYSDITPTSSPVTASNQSFGSRSEASLVELEPTKPTIVTSHIDEVNIAAKTNDATASFLPSIKSADTCFTTEGSYSGMPTMPFSEAPLSNHNGPTPSNMPTKLYDEAHPSQFSNAVLLSSHNNTIVTSNHPPSRLNLSHLSHSNEHLLGQQRPLEHLFEPESFDSISYSSELARSHKNVAQS